MKYLRRAVVVILIFTVETAIQLLLIVFIGVILLDPPYVIDFQTVMKDFSDTLYFVGTIKLAFFLPVYLLVYLLRANYLENLVKLQFGLHGLCFFVVCLLFLPFMATANGLVMILLGLLGSFLSIGFLNAVWLSRKAVSEPIGDM